ncbi:hypothetical protein SETIT_3G072900v2 [Setaria italica]|uniref:RNase H type-1 domain-containing protein n=2 Tax=Setaria TaxID=4554 RepID=A0A368QCC3_SETIT|nr:hypothetical protein SETIT_3G072900v2 [Setaria italica]TKW24811.1 hypothetical protein SEVIR_3G074500v2 [Setaria viridis]
MGGPRNDVRNSEIKVCPKSLVKEIQVYVDMIMMHCLKPIHPLRCATQNQSQKWVPPPAGLVCVNVDASVSSSSSSSACGVVIRDHKGMCLAACCQSFHGVTIPEIAEALALRSAANLARMEGFNKLVFQSDCLTLIKKH